MRYAYLQIDGIEGGVTVQPYRGWIEVDSYSVGNAVGLYGESRPTKNELGLRTAIDRSYGGLQLAITSGQKLASAKLVALDKEDGPPYFAIHMTDVTLIHLVLVSGKTEKDPRLEMVLSFGAVEKLDGHTAWSTKGG